MNDEVKTLTSLTFAELRLATMLSNHAGSEPDPTQPDFMHALGLERIASLDRLRTTLADVVIQADRFAAERDIDLAAAIRSRLHPNSSR